MIVHKTNYCSWGSYSPKDTTNALPLIGKTSDYVPLFTIYRPNTVSSRGYYTISKKFQEYYDRLTHSTSIPLQRLIAKMINNGRVSQFKHMGFILNSLQSSIDEFINDSDLDFVISPGSGGTSGNSYQDVFNSFSGINLWRKFSLRNANYLTNLGCLAITDKVTSGNINMVRNLNPNVTILACYMVKAEMIPYIRMCFLMGEKPHPDALELWVKSDLDIPKGPYNNIRSKYRKEVKKSAVDRGIKIYEFPDLTSMIFHSAELPTFRRIKDRKDWYKQVSDLYLQSIKVKSSLSENGIKLVEI